VGRGKSAADQSAAGGYCKIAQLRKSHGKRYVAAFDAIADGRFAASSSAHYIGAEAFTRLFEKNGGNQKRGVIARAIYLIAMRFVDKLRGFPRAWLEDAASEAAILGIRKIWHYQKNCSHKNAFSYFTKLIQNKVWEQLRMQSRLEQGLSPWGRPRRCA
jgi:hypothetical protein